MLNANQGIMFGPFHVHIIYYEGKKKEVVDIYKNNCHPDVRTLQYV